MTDEDMIFPEEGFPSMEELTAGAGTANKAQDAGLSTACSNRAQTGGAKAGAQAAEGCAAACAAGSDAAKTALQSGFLAESDTHLGEKETKWLRFFKQYPRYVSQPLPAGMNAAVEAGEDPTMAFLRLENARLEHDMELLRREQVLRAACVGSAKSAAVPEEPDDFAKGLLMG